jgi:hypothetical protein
VILSHAQFSVHSRTMHQVHAGFLLLSAVCRAARRINEYSLFAVLSGAAFIFSSECPIRYAEDVDVNPAGYVLGVLAIGALLWTWTVHLIAVAAPPAPVTAADRRMHKLAARQSAYGAVPAETQAEAADDV